jgi:hypothetical protein
MVAGEDTKAPKVDWLQRRFYGDMRSNMKAKFPALGEFVCEKMSAAHNKQGSVIALGDPVAYGRFENRPFFRVDRNRLSGVSTLSRGLGQSCMLVT